MKIFKLILVLFLLNVSHAGAEEWTDEIVRLNPGVIDSVQIIKGKEEGMNLESYLIYYNQPLQHDNPELGTLPLRALLTVRTDTDFLQPTSML